MVVSACANLQYRAQPGVAGAIIGCGERRSPGRLEPLPDRAHQSLRQLHPRPQPTVGAAPVRAAQPGPSRWPRPPRLCEVLERILAGVHYGTSKQVVRMRLDMTEV